MLYLLKGSRIREYHQQNVAILGAPEGGEIQITYNLRWVEPGLVPRRGDGGVLVFSDAPYVEFAPIRFAKLVDVVSGDDRLDLRVELGPFVRPGSQTELTELLLKREGDSRPGKQFLFEDENAERPPGPG